MQFYSSFKQEPGYNLDFVRYTTLELRHKELIRNNIQGNVAELGVYKGEFAKRLNQKAFIKMIYPQKNKTIFQAAYRIFQTQVLNF